MLCTRYLISQLTNITELVFLPGTKILELSFKIRLLWLGFVIQSSLTFKLVLMAQYSPAGDKPFRIWFGYLHAGDKILTNDHLRLNFWR